MRKALRIPPTIAQPLSWRSEPGLFGQRYWARFTDGSYRRVSRDEIARNATRD